MAKTIEGNFDAVTGAGAITGTREIICNVNLNAMINKKSPDKERGCR